MWWLRILTIISIEAVGRGARRKTGRAVRATNFTIVACSKIGFQRTFADVGRKPSIFPNPCGNQRRQQLWQVQVEVANLTGWPETSHDAAGDTESKGGFHASARQDAPEEDDGGCGDRRDFPAKRQYVLRASKAGSSGPGRSPEACFPWARDWKM